MGHSKFYQLNLLFLGLFLLAACDRPEGNGTTSVVRLQLPKFTQSSSIQSAIQTQSVSGKTLDEGDSWGQSDPASLAEIGCYGVMVSDDVAGNTGQCLYGSGQTFKFKYMVGLLESGKSLEIADLPFGSHTFYVVGMKKGSQACEQIVGGGNISSANYSNPLLLGQATQDLRLASESVTVNVSLNPLTISSSKIGNCSFGGDKKFTNLSFRGATDYQNSIQSLRMDNNTCAKYYAVLSNSPNGGGGGINDIDRSFQLNYGASTISGGSFSILPQFYSDSTCTTAIADGGTLTISKGDTAFELYAKGYGTGVSGWSIGGASGDRLFTITDITPSSTSPISAVSGKLMVQKMTSGSQQFNPFVHSISIYPGECREVEYYWTQFDATTGREFATNVNSGLPLLLKTNSGTTVNPPSANSGFDNASCAGASNANIAAMDANEAFGSFFMKVGTDWTGAPYLENLKIIVNGQIGRAINVNPVPLASKLAVSTPASSPFASDCVTLTVTPKDQLDIGLDIFGYDRNSSIKGIPLQGGFMTPTGGAWLYQSTDCATNQLPYNWTAPASATGSPTHIPVSFRPGFPGVAGNLNISGWPVVRGNSDNNGLTITALWDPAVIGGTSLKRWGRPENISGAGFADVTGLTGWPFNIPGSGTGFSGVVGTASVVSGDLTLKADTTANSISFDGGIGPENIHTSGVGLSDFLIAALVKINTANTNDVLFEIDAAGTLHDVHILSSNLILGSSTAIGANNVGSWQVVFVKRQGAVWQGTAWQAAQNQTGAFATAGSISDAGVLNYIYLGTSQSSHAINGNVAEVLAIDMTGKATIDFTVLQTKIYDYMKARYPAAGL